MSRRWLGLLSLVGLLGCAGLEVDNPALRCSASQACPDELVCYRSFCVEPSDDLAGDAGVDETRRDAATADAGDRDAAVADAAGAPPRDREDAGDLPVDPGPPSPPAVPEPAAPPPTPVPVPPVTEPPAPPAPPPESVSDGPWAWPWRLDALRNLPPYLLGCLGSCTIVGQKECESCVADKERQRRSESRAFCDEDDEDDEGRRGKACGARR